MTTSISFNSNPKSNQNVRSIIFKILFVAICVVTPTAGYAQMRVGTNLDGAPDWEATKFANVLNQQRDWMTRNADGSGDWDSDLTAQVPRSNNGWPVVVPFVPANGAPPQIVHTVFPVAGPGNYRLIVRGKGRVVFIASDGLLDPKKSGNHRVTYEFEGGQKTFNLRVYDSDFGDGSGTIFLEYHESDPADPVRDMRLVTPGHLRTFWKQPFLPQYTDNLSLFSNLRFMDWGHTNDSPLRHWRDRTRRNVNTQAGTGGIAIEYMVQLANQQRQDMWICIPAEASDHFVRNSARVILSQLDPDLKVFVEYSNETWNSIFSQTSYVQMQGQRLWLSPDPWESGQMFVAMRSAEIWGIFADIFGDQATHRMVKVMASHADNISLSQSRLEYLQDPELNPSGIRADAIAIAPYFGGTVADDLVREGVVGSVTPQEIVSRAREDMQQSARLNVELHQQLAKDYDLWLVMYEGGQHLVGSFEDFDNQALTNKLIAANRHPSMYDLYYDYLNMLNENDVALFSNFSYMYEPTRFGSWGIFENPKQPINEAHKFQAIADWIVSNPPKNMSPVPRPGDDISMVDRDENGWETISLDGSESRDFDGRVVSFIWTIDGQAILENEVGEVRLPLGEHEVLLTVRDEKGASSKRSVVVTIAPNSARRVLVESDFRGTAPATKMPWKPTRQVDDHVTVAGWSLGAGLGSTNLNNGIGFAGDLDGEPRSLSDAIANGEYLSFRVSPTSGYQLDLRGAELVFAIERLSYHAPRRFIVASSVNGFRIGQEIYTSPRTEEESSVEMSFTLPFDGYRTSRSIEFRIYPIEGQWSGHEAGLRAFRLHGASTQSLFD